MKSVVVAYIIILSVKPHSNDVKLFDAVAKDHQKFHIVVYSNLNYKVGDVIEHGMLHQIPDSLLTK